ncbi:kinase-like domain-containing protein [Poronia punctata]|nr:kinase-like domain-containing protein [Poronia punctata]
MDFQPSETACQSTPISHLESHNLECRILIQPQDPSQFRSESGSYVNHVSLHLRSYPNASYGTIRCIAIMPCTERASYTILEPVRCEIYYDSKGSSVFIRHRLMLPAFTLCDSDEACGEVATGVTVPPFTNFQVDPGAWAIYSGAGPCGLLFQFLVYPRSHSLSVLQMTALPQRTEPKRKLSEMDETLGTQTPDTRLPIRAIDSLVDVTAGETVCVTRRQVEEYRIQRLQEAGFDTEYSTVFKAKVTAYPNEVVAVKVIKGQDPVSRAKAWEHEVRFHRRLQSDVIVSLLGADARLSALYLKAVNAFDLGHRGWRDRSFYFKGNNRDALRVLGDMGRALEYLRKHDIVHHDIKPSNILYRSEAGAVLIDFGLGSSSNSDGHTGGTPWYVGPEYLSSDNQGRQDGKGLRAFEDVWALGVVMLYLLRFIPLPDTGQQVKSWLIKDVGKPDSEATERMRLWLDVVGDIVKEKLDDGDDFHDIIRRMLTRSPETRIEPEQIVEALKKITTLEN